MLEAASVEKDEVDSYVLTVETSARLRGSSSESDLITHLDEITIAMEDDKLSETEDSCEKCNKNNENANLGSPKIAMTLPPRIKTPGSPNLIRKLLPSTPTFYGSHKKLNKSQEDLTNNGSNVMDRFRYDTIARKKKESKLKKRMSSSTFYVSGDHLDTGFSISNSEDNLTAFSSETGKARLKEPSPLFTMKHTSPKGKGDSPKDKRKDNQTLKKKLSKGQVSFGSEKQTHVALYKFFARHKDELTFNEGDPLHILKMYDDLWYEGINLTTGKHGLFPCRYVADILSDELESSIEDPSDHKQFQLRFLGSLEVLDNKGDEILTYAIAKVVNQRSMLSSANPPTCVLQLSRSGVRICKLSHEEKPPPMVHENEKKGKKGKHLSIIECEHPEENHYFSLKNVTFCGNHPKDKRYFGFITKHPDHYRFACHVFMSKYSTDPIMKMFGECFEKFYTKYMEYRASTEDIYLE